MSYDPYWRRPLMKNVGVPVTPLRSAPSMSSAMGFIPLIVLPAPNPDRVQPTDFDHADRLIGRALQAARRTLDDIPASDVLAA
jgi:hypothetical protein